MIELGTLFSFQKPKLLSVVNVYSDMVKIARMSGNNSQASKCSIIKSLLVRCDKLSEEAKYVIRGLQGKLRIGLAGQSILMSLSQAFFPPEISRKGVNKSRVVSTTRINSGWLYSC